MSASPFGLGLLPPFDVSSQGQSLMAAGRDRDIIEDARARLESSLLFAGAIYGSWPRDAHAGSDMRPLALLAPLGWEEEDSWDPVVILRTYRFRVAIVDKAEESGDRYSSLDRLANEAMNLIIGASLADKTLPGMTRASRGTYFPATAPDEVIVIDFEAPYMVDGYQGRDLTD